MRALITACLLALAAPAYAADAPPKWLDGGKPQPGWRYVFSPTNWEAVFILDEPMFFDEWPRVTLWSRHEFNAKAEDTAYGSALALLSYDCSREGEAEYARYTFAKALLEGEPTLAVSEQGEPEWRFPPPGDGMRTFVQAVCKIARKEHAQGDPVVNYLRSSEGAKPGALLEEIKRSPQLSAYTSLHDLFPQDWKVLEDQIALIQARPTAEQDWAKVVAFLTTFIDQREKYVSLASEGTLRSLALSEAKVLKLIRERSVSDCVAHAYQGASPDMTDPPEALAQNDAVKAKLTAIHEGMTRPVRRNGANQSDTAALAKAFKAQGGNAVQWSAIYEGETEKLAPADRCNAWIAFYGALATAPEGPAGRWAAWFFDPSDDNRTTEPEPAGFTPSST